MRPLVRQFLLRNVSLRLGVGCSVSRPYLGPATSPQAATVATPLKHSYWYAKEYKHVPAMVDLDSVSTTQKMRQEIHMLIHQDKNYDALAKLLLDNHAKLVEILGPEGITKAVRYLVDHSVEMLQRYALELVKLDNVKGKDGRPRAKPGTLRFAQFHEALYFARTVREIYLRLLQPDVGALGARYHIYGDKLKGLSGSFQLSPRDFENLIILEKRWNKRDLCDYLFTQFDRTLGAEAMTYPLWVAKLQLYCGGDSRMWPSQSEFYPAVADAPILWSFFKAEHKGFRHLLSDFILRYVAPSNAKVLSNDILTTLVALMGYYHMTRDICDLIKLTWGIDENFELVAAPVKLGLPQYPTLKTLEAIVDAFSYNHEFFEGMKYINAIRDHYNIDVSLRHARSFWETIFHWVHVLTRYKPDMALQHYLKHTNSTQRHRTLAEAQADASFDYLGYLQYLGRLKKQRDDTYSHIWNMYTQNQVPGELVFSAAVAKNYYYYLVTKLKVDNDPTPMYEFLRYLRQVYAKVHQSKHSYNLRADTKGKVRSPARAIDQVYSMALIQLVEHKALTLKVNECEPVINKWSLNKAMQQRLMNWYRTRKLAHWDRVERERMKHIAELRTEKGEDDGFLDLL